MSASKHGEDPKPPTIFLFFYESRSRFMHQPARDFEGLRCKPTPPSVFRSPEGGKRPRTHPFLGELCPCLLESPPGLSPLLASPPPFSALVARPTGGGQGGWVVPAVPPTDHRLALHFPQLRHVSARPNHPLLPHSAPFDTPQCHSSPHPCAFIVCVSLPWTHHH